MNTVDTIIFDVGRVLVRLDTGGERFGRLMRAAGVSADRIFDIYWPRNIVLEHMTGKIDSGEFYRRSLEKLSVPFSYEEFADAWCDLFQPMPGMEMLFKILAKRYKMGLLSDTDPLHWAALLKMFPWLKMVEKPTLSYEVGVTKPHPEMYVAAAYNCGSVKERCLFIDDVPANVDGARFYGMLAIPFRDPKRLLKNLQVLNLL